MKKIATLAAALAAAALFTGCTEIAQEPGKSYAGKEDSKPYAGDQFKGDKAAWDPRIAQGMDTMMKIAINGKGAMPPRGASTASDDELRAAVQYMVDAAK